MGKVCSVKEAAKKLFNSGEKKASKYANVFKEKKSAKKVKL